MTDKSNEHRRGRGRHLFWLLIAFFASAVAITWAWNDAGAALFDLPAARFSEIGAVLIAALAIGALLRFAFSGGGQGRRRHQ